MHAITSFAARLLYAIIIAIVIAAAVVAFAPAWAQPSATKGVIRVGSDLTYPPYDYVVQGQPAGFDVDLMMALARTISMKAEFVDVRFDKLVTSVQTAQIDVIASTLYANPKRELLIDFVPYMRTGISIAVLAAGGKSFKTPEELCGHNVGSIKGAAWIDKLTTLNNAACYGHPIRIREFPTSPEVMQALLAGTVDAQIEDSAVLKHAVGELGARVLISSNENFYPVVVGFGVRKGNAELIGQINKGLRRLRATGCYDELLRKYNVSRPGLVEFYLPLEDDVLMQARKRQGIPPCA